MYSASAVSTSLWLWRRSFEVWLTSSLIKRLLLISASAARPPLTCNHIHSKPQSTIFTEKLRERSKIFLLIETLLSIWAFSHDGGILPALRLKTCLSCGPAQRANRRMSFLLLPAMWDPRCVHWEIIKYLTPRKASQGSRECSVWRRGAAKNQGCDQICRNSFYGTRWVHFTPAWQRFSVSFIINS